HEIYKGKKPDYRDGEWYTLGENLYRAYMATGNEEYKTFAQVWDYPYYWDILLNGRLELMTGLHGYSHVNALGGPALAYRATGDERYKETLVRAYGVLAQNQLFASGGYAPNEEMADPSGSNYHSVETARMTFEVCCGSWAALKLVRHLIALTGEARYGEWAETILYNSIGAALPMTDSPQRRGKTFYYADYRIGGGRNVYYPCSFPCCAGTYPQAVAEYVNAIYYYDKNAVYVAQYIPSAYETNIGGTDVKLTLDGNYPDGDEINVSIGLSRDAKFPVKFRVPSWVRRGCAWITVNGAAFECETAPGEWTAVDRIWKNGDSVKLFFQKILWLKPIHPNYPKRVAFMHGPLMLAAEGRRRHIIGDLRAPESMLLLIGDNRFAGITDGNEKTVFRPFRTFGERDWYTVYLDIVG
ncbi:MAG: glycoside hydrolase family 127 protein, partial [Defluviitaleaceae bacterium]|nr:glycoside hydrolase family 127 protein [Defluviitaleaceae bacterium]